MIFQLSARNKSSIKPLVLIIVCVSIGGWIPRHLTISPTNSLSEHLFVLQRDVLPSQIRQKDIVRFQYGDTVTEHAMHEFKMNKPHLLKRVGCIQGHVLNVDNHRDYFCDGAYLGRAKSKSLTGAIVKNFVWHGDVPQGEFFAIGDHVDSYDSRYFGFVDLSAVEGKAYPLF